MDTFCARIRSGGGGGEREKSFQKELSHKSLSLPGKTYDQVRTDRQTDRQTSVSPRLTAPFLSFLIRTHTRSTVTASTSDLCLVYQSAETKTVMISFVCGELRVEERPGMMTLIHL